nr:fasciclin domain-containing protein [Allomuricauda sp.]|tara:strand:+ start:56808 stop:59312 length:2505 start_codon:yes stop_codon:yes gene_type:complete
MKKKFLPLKGILMAFLMVFALSCEKEDDGNEPGQEETTGTIVETAQGNESLTSLVAALQKADENENSDLIGTLSGNGPFTVFAPTNDAFSALLSELDGFETLDDFDTEEERALLADILKYHVVAGAAVLSTNLTDAQNIETVLGETVTVSLDGAVYLNDATNGNAEVIIPDVMASNGVVHVIDKVLLPQSVLDALGNEEEEEEADKNLVEIVVETETLSVLEAAVIKADLVETLSSEGPFTVFAPTDDAFVSLLDILGDDYNSLDDFDTEEEMALLKDILLFHVVASKVLAADLEGGTVATALAENNLAIIAEGDSFVIGDASEVNANITATDILASNGVAHTIDKVLLPQSAIDFVASLQAKNIVEIAQETNDLSILVDALITADAGLVETLSGDGPFTVFAPTNDAFAALLDALGDDYNSLADFDTEAEINLLVDILKYHVVAGTAAFSTDLADNQMIATVKGENVTISLDGGVKVFDASGNSSTVTTGDVEASNGVVHIIDRVLLPQSAVDFLASLQMKNIVELAIDTDDLSLLVDALVAADSGLVQALSGEGPFTVFAPTNQAFANLLHFLGDDFNSLADFDTDAEIDILVKVLKYHVVAGTAAFSTDLSDGQHIGTLQGENLGIILNSGVHIDDATDTNATVVLADVEASNGVVHVIDKVLLPQEVLDALVPPQPNIVELAQSVDDLSLLVDALIQADAGLVEALSGEGPFTVFAPTNQAFANLLHDLGDAYHSLEDFDTDEEKELLAKILTYHVLAGAAVASGDLSDHQELVTLQGESLFAILNHGVFIRDKTHVDAQVIGADNEASNGIVHLIDKVLLPQEVLDELH